MKSHKFTIYVTPSNLYCGHRDILALVAELLDDPNWALHATAKLGADKDFERWPVESGWWLMKRHRLLKKLGLRG